MSDSKIQIKVGIVEFSGEGNQDWLAEQFDKILLKVPELLKMEIEAPQQNNLTNKEGSGGNGTSKVLKLSIINIAAKLGCKSGPDLITAAAAYLRFNLGKTSFTRSEILNTMKDATGYYKAMYRKNLSQGLRTLLKSTLSETATDIYSLQIDKEKELDAILSR